MKKIWLILVIALFSCNADEVFAVTTPNSFHFQAVPASSEVCNATTSSSNIQLTAGAAANSPDMVVRNIGVNPGYFEIGTGSLMATVPTSGNGSQVINPGEADILSKTNADTFACITSTSTTTLVITPGTGN